MTSEIIDCKNVARGSVIDVETRSRHYQIECLGGHHIRISGHPDYCPNPVPAQLKGSIDPKGVLELGMIAPGRQLVFLLNDHCAVTTSQVLHVHVDPPHGGPPAATMN